MIIDGIPVAGLSAPALLGLAVLLLLVGRIVPKRTLDDKAAEAEKWREAYETERESRQQVESHYMELQELAKTTHAVLVAMFDTIEKTRKGGEPDGAMGEEQKA